MNNNIKNIDFLQCEVAVARNGGPIAAIRKK